MLRYWKRSFVIEKNLILKKNLCHIVHIVIKLGAYPQLPPFWRPFLPTFSVSNIVGKTLDYTIKIIYDNNSLLSLLTILKHVCCTYVFCREKRRVLFWWVKEMGASLGKVCRVTRRLCRKIKNKIKKKCLVSLLGRKLFRPPSYMLSFEVSTQELS